MIKTTMIVVIISAFLLFGCCASTAEVKEKEQSEKEIVDAVANSTCVVGKLSLIEALYIDAKYHIGTDAKWYGFAIRNSDASYDVFINWQNEDEERKYKFTYDPTTKKVGSLNKEARLVLDVCPDA